MRSWGAVLIVMCFGTGGRADVAFPPGVYTVPEIARRLSVEGKTVQVPDALQDRAAFISLKSRPWDEVVDVLGRGLKLRLIAQGNDGTSFKVAEDSAVAARERTSRAALSAWLTGRIREQSRAVEQAGRDFAANPKALTPRINELRQRLRRNSLRENQRRSLMREIATLEQAQEVLNFASPRVGAAVLSQGLIPAPDDVTQTSRSFGSVPVAALPQEAVRAVIAGRDDPTPFPADFGVVGGFLFYRGVEQLRLRFSCALVPSVGRQIPCAPRFEAILTGATGAAGSSLADTLYLGDGDLYHGLGAKAAEEYRRALSETEAFLTGQDGKQLLRPPASPIRALSQVVQLWAEQTDGEALMELLPLADRLPPTRRDGAVPLEDDGEAGPPVWNGVALSLGKVTHTRGDWSFLRYRGVLIVEDRLRFLDAQYRYPVAAAMVYARSTGTAPRPSEAEGQGDLLFRYADFEAYYKRIAGRPTQPWGAASPRAIRDYRGVRAVAFDTARLPVWAWQRLAPQIEREVITPGRSRKEYPLALLSPDDLKQMAALLRQQSSEFIAWHDSFARRLSEYKLLVIWSGSGETPEARTLTLSLNTDTVGMPSLGMAILKR